jgi:site-specific recombinase XerD
MPDGSRYRETVGTKKQAEKVHQRIEADIISGRWKLQRPKDILFRDFLKKYLEDAMGHKAQSTREIDTYRIDKHLLPYFGKVLVKDITVQMVDRYKAERIKADAEPATINKELANLSHMLKTAIRWQYIDMNVVSSVEKMKLAKRTPRFLTVEEIAMLIKAAEGSHIHPIIVTAIHIGMRKSELYNLQYSDIDFDNSIIIVQSKPDWHTKNYKPRTLRMTPMLERVLRQHKKTQESQGYLSDYVLTYEGKRITWGVDIGLKTITDRIGFKDVTLHTLRHTFASQMVMAGAPLGVVQELMGHQSFQTTIQYAHLQKEHAMNHVLKLPFANS